MIVTRVLGEYRIQHAGLFVGTDHPGSDARLVLADEAIERLGFFPRDSLGYVFDTHSQAHTALATINNLLHSYRL